MLGKKIRTCLNAKCHRLDHDTCCWCKVIALKPYKPYHNGMRRIRVPFLDATKKKNNVEMTLNKHGISILFAGNNSIE